MNSDLAWLVERLTQWWPALILAVLVYWGLGFLWRGTRSSPKRLDRGSLQVHEVCTTLACTEQQAKNLIAKYDGNVSKAIQDVKTGRTVLPGSEVSDLAIFVGEFKRFERLENAVLIHLQDASTTEIGIGYSSLLTLGVIDESQRPDKLGLARADRGQGYGQLFWLFEQQWYRCLLNANRMDYFDLGERKQNSAIRNFRIVIHDLLEAAPKLVVTTPLDQFESDLRLPLYKSVAALEAEATQVLRNWSFQ